MKEKRTHFYKYTTSNAACNILENISVKYSSPLIFNDPFDIQLDIDFGVDDDILAEALVEELEEIVYGVEDPSSDSNNPLFNLACMYRTKETRLPQSEFRSKLESWFKEGKKNALPEKKQTIERWRNDTLGFRVFCVAEENDNLLMWAHYADNHNGAVIKFRCLHEWKTRLCNADKVKYKDAPPVIASKEEWVKHITGQSGISFDSRFYDYFITKSSHWSYEKEWRIVTTKLNDNLFEFHPILPEEIEAIYLGCKISKEDTERITQLLVKYFSHVKLFRTSKVQNKYELAFTKLNY